MPELFAFDTTVEFAIALGIMLLGGMVHGLTGFGGALVTMPLLALLLSPVEALALSAPAWVLGTLQMLPRASREADWPVLWPILIPALLATPLGTLLLFAMEPDIVRRTIGLFVLAGAVMLAKGWTYRGPRGRLPGIVAGSLCGGITGFAGVGGPPVVLYVMAWPDPPAMQRANIVVVVGSVGVMTLLGIIVGGAYDGTVALTALILAVAYVAGTWSGSAGFRAASDAFFRRAALTVLFASGIAAIVL